MDSFILFLKLGLFHVLDRSAYDHILFLIVLSIVYTLYDSKKVIWLITLFTIGHTLSLSLAAYKIITVDNRIVEFLIPITILITALTNIVTVKEKQKKSTNINLVFAFFFGLIHGLGFSSYFKMIVEETEAKLLPLLEFALGIELAQIIIVLGILSVAYFVLKILKISRRDWIVVLSSIVIGIVIPMLAARKFW